MITVTRTRVCSTRRRVSLIARAISDSNPSTIANTKSSTETSSHIQPSPSIVPSSSVVAQHLPPELVVSIFQHLVSDVSRSLCGYHPDPHHSPVVRIPAQEIPRLTAAQRDLSFAMRSCRSWYRSGCAVLYSSPFVGSHGSIRHFSRTVCRSPDLGNMVKHLVSLDATPSRMPEQRPHLSMDWPVSSSRVNSEKAMVRKQFSAALTSCPNLLSLVIITCSEKDSNILPVAEGLMPSLTQSSLRSLTIHGSSVIQYPHKLPFSLSSQLRMPLLETLYLRNVYFPTEPHFPHLPRLHTLHISQCSSIYARPMSITIPHSAMPSLKTLELFENRARIVLEKATMHQLESLHYIGAEESYLITLWGRFLTEDFKRLEHLTVGFNDDAELAAVERLPPHLQSLTIHVQPDYELLREDLRVASPIMLESLHNLLTKPSSTIPQSLRDIYVNIEPSNLAQTERELHLVAPRLLKNLYQDGADKGFNVHTKLQAYAGYISERLAPGKGQDA